MEFRDFKRHFERVDMCHLGPESMTGKGKRKWEAVSQDGKWQRGASAGGCRNYPGEKHNTSISLKRLTKHRFSSVIFIIKQCISQTLERLYPLLNQLRPSCIKLEINSNFAINSLYHRILDCNWLRSEVAMVYY